MNNELTDFWHCAQTSNSSRQCLGKRTIKFEDKTTESIDLESGGDYASASKWESDCHKRIIQAPIKTSMRFCVGPYRWLFWDYNVWKVNWLLTWMVCGSRISPATFDGNGDDTLRFSSHEDGKLKKVKCGDLDTICDELFIIIRTANTLFAGSRNKLWFEMFRTGGGGGMKEQLVSVGGFSSNRTYGFWRSAHQVPDKLTVASVKSINLETDGSDALYLTDVFVFGRNSKSKEFTVFAFSSGMERRKQISQQDGEGVNSLEIPLIRSFNSESNIFSTVKTQNS